MNTHPNTNTLLLVLYEELSGQELETVRIHLAECKTCQKDMAALEDTLKVYRRVPEENPPDEILSVIMAKKKGHVPRYPQVISWIESLFPKPRWRWALASFAGILTIAGVLYLADRSSSLSPREAVIEFEWRSSLGDSLESLSERLVLLRENATAFSSPSTAGALTSLGSIDNEVLELKARISSFSSTLSTNTF